MTRIDELQQKYPSIPREVIVKAAALGCGIAESEDLDEVGRWIPSVGPHTTYNYDHDVSLKEVANRKPATVRPGYTKYLGAFATRNGLLVEIQRDSTSPYQIRKLGSGQFALYEGEEKVEDIYFPHMPLPYDDRQEPVTSRGSLATSLVNLKAPNCFTIVPTRYCEYFSNGEECQFCNFNSGMEDARTTGVDLQTTLNLDETVEAYKLISSDVRFLEGHLVMGGFRNTEKQAKLHLNFVERIVGAVPHKPNIHAVLQPISRKNMERLKDCGANTISQDIEIWDPRMFAEICPAKEKYTGYERYKESFLEAVDVFGAGSVNCLFAGGVTLIPPTGHKTWQDARDSMIEAFNWLMKNDVYSTYTYFRWAPGSAYSRDASGRNKVAPTEFYLEVASAHHRTAKEYGLYQKLNKLLSSVCPMDCLKHTYGGDIGFLEIGGNIGNWLADTIPDKANWLAHFNSAMAAR